MLVGTIIENSLNDTSVLNHLNIIKSWTAGSWMLHQVSLEREKALDLGRYLADGPWYMHFWNPEKDTILVVFKDKTFDITRSDTSTWKEAVQYGKFLHISEEQLTFATN